ncbi:MAG: hypothetical protein NT075_32000 [Chloroflexi bacterium]|nr:hypothetical protein [Chloroflexota bacterium]
MLIIGQPPIQVTAQTSPPRAAATVTIETGHSPAQAYLRVNNHILIDEPGNHLDRPQLSPDGQTVAVAVMPTGSEAAALARLSLFDSASGQLLITVPGHTPHWAADGATVTFEDGGKLVTYNLKARQVMHTEDRPSEPTAQPPVDAATRHAPLAPFAYPETIRVLHHANNACRDEPAGQIDVIPFEEYVARVVPAEMPAFWQFAALGAQAVAARTYAWAQILAGRPDYDVTDWANFQMMCDDHYPISDAAVAATTGQYLSEIGDVTALPISAMYSAENGHPTLTNPNVTYLQAVPDLFALGQVRNGHGYGLSQWGAQRRALAGQTYQQILGHYYTNVNLQNGTNPGQLLGGLHEPLVGDAITANALHWHALTSYAASDITLKIHSPEFTEPVSLNGSEGVWRAPFQLADKTALTAELWVDGARQDQVVLPVDTTAPPAPSLTMPAVVNSPQFSITTTAETDALVGLSQAWLWEGETLSHTQNSGAVVADVNATNGLAWSARAGVDQAGAWYGPYTTLLAPGRDYRAIFWLRANVAMGAQVTAVKTKAVQATTPIAHLDVTDQGGDDILGLRDVWLSDFASADGYRPIAVDFHLFEAADGLEFRVAWPGKIDLALDKVQIWTLPNAEWATGQSFTWDVYSGAGRQTITAASFDRAGNISQPVSQTIQIIDNQPPVFGPVTAPTGWISATTFAVSTTLLDKFSGLDLQSVALTLGDQAISATLDLPDSPWRQQIVTATISPMAEAKYTAHFRAADQAGNQAESATFPIWVDRSPPTVTATLNMTTTDPWFTTPVTVTLVAGDQLSGVKQIAYTLNDKPGLYTQPLAFTEPGIHNFRYWARDAAGNRPEPQTLQVLLELSAPTVDLIPLALAPDKVQLQWHARDDASGVVSVELETQQPDGAWQSYATSPFTQTAGALDFAVEQDHPLGVRMRATDRAKRIGEWTAAELVAASDWIYLPQIMR